MNIRADLHCHTNSSDGALSPSEVVKLAKKNAVSWLAVTDHDTVSGLSEAADISKSLNINFIPGIELSCNHNNESIHILGYFTGDQYTSDSVTSFLQELKESRKQRAFEIIRKLKENFNIDIKESEVMKLANGILARPHIAKAIVNSGYNYSFNYIFDNFIGNNCPAYVPNKHVSIEEGIKFLKSHGCIVVLAHPKLIKKTPINEILAFPFDGIEAIYYQNSKKETKFFRKAARDNNLVITCGSDFHGMDSNDTKHGTVGTMSIPEDDFKKFINLYNHG